MIRASGRRCPWKSSDCQSASSKQSNRMKHSGKGSLGCLRRAVLSCYLFWIGPLECVFVSAACKGVLSLTAVNAKVLQAKGLQAFTPFSQNCTHDRLQGDMVVPSTCQGPFSTGEPLFDCGVSVDSSVGLWAMIRARHMEPMIIPTICFPNMSPATDGSVSERH